MGRRRPDTDEKQHYRYRRCADQQSWSVKRRDWRSSRLTLIIEICAFARRLDWQQRGVVASVLGGVLSLRKRSRAAERAMFIARTVVDVPLNAADKFLIHLETRSKNALSRPADTPRADNTNPKKNSL